MQITTQPIFHIWVTKELSGVCVCVFRRKTSFGNVLDLITHRTIYKQTFDFSFSLHSKLWLLCFLLSPGSLSVWRRSHTPSCGYSPAFSRLVAFPLEQRPGDLLQNNQKSASKILVRYCGSWVGSSVVCSQSLENWGLERKLLEPLEARGYCIYSFIIHST